MNHPVFVSMSDRKMASLIGDASGRVTVQFYKATSNGVVSEQDMTA